MSFIKYYNFSFTKKIKHGSLKIFNFSLFSFYKVDGFMWFRLFGHGLTFKDLGKYDLLFSERNNKNLLIINNWLITTI